MGGGEAVSMRVLYHISQEDEYRLLHCSNASLAILCSLMALALPFFLAEIDGAYSTAGNPCGLPTVVWIFPPFGSHAAVRAMHFNNAKTIGSLRTQRPDMVIFFWIYP
jgi:hypothetical protein